ncbi:hypothetical protein [Nocardioides lijunqiniae]|uniref:hypothetical protein n=1 Tax=Nocardioides lijunqiniae TaxID=2760832 RepID=UPI00187894BA|nr:hypothetical protein [Nocardioides lijunqiniae]
MAATDRIRSAASGAAVIGTAIGARAVRTVRPLLARALRRAGDATGRGTGPAAPPRPAAAPTTPSAPAPSPSSSTSAAPSPAAVARNVAPRPAATKAARKPATRSAPGAKLPVRRLGDA